MTETKNKSKKRNLIIIICAVAAVALAFVMINAKPGRKQVTGDTVTEVAAARMTIENTIESDGEIISAMEENVLPHTSYYLEEINVEEGEAVEEGGTILTYTNGYEMTAPYNCVVKGWDLPDEDDQLTSDHYVTIAGTDVMELELSISEDEVSSVAIGDKASVTVDAVGKSYDAEVSYVSQAGSYSGGSSTFTARISFDNDGKLKLGMSGSAVISLEKAEDVIAVPASAVSIRDGKSYVTTVSDGEQNQTEVVTGLSNGSFTEIKSGLNEGDKVIVAASDDSRSMFGGDWMEGMGGGPDDMGDGHEHGGGPDDMGGGHERGSGSN